MNRLLIRISTETAALVNMEEDDYAEIIGEVPLEEYLKAVGNNERAEIKRWLTSIDDK